MSMSLTTTRPEAPPASEGPAPVQVKPCPWGLGASLCCRSLCFCGGRWSPVPRPWALGGNTAGRTKCLHKLSCHSNDFCVGGNVGEAHAFRKGVPAPTYRQKSANVSGASLEVSVLGREENYGLRLPYPNLGHPLTS